MKDSFKKIDHYLVNNTDLATDFLGKLIRFQTENPPGSNYHACSEYLTKSVEKLGFKSRNIKVPLKEAKQVIDNAKEFPRFNVIARWNTGAKKTLHFNSHYDVVPASSKGWNSNPFKERIERGRVYGRGSGDMKGAIAATWYALKAVKEVNLTPTVNVELSFTADEETGGALGAKYLVSNDYVKADYAVVCEGGSKNRIGYGHNGALCLKVSLKGKSAHAAYPHCGINAFEHMAALVGVLREKHDKISKSFTTYSGEKMLPSLTLGGIFNGSSNPKENILPGFAEFSIDRRVLPNENYKQVETDLIKWIKDYEKKAKGLKIKVEKIFSVKQSIINPKKDFPQKFLGIVKNVRKQAVDFQVNAGFTDMHWFLNHGKIPTIGYGPGGKNHHGANEQTSISDIVNTAKVYTRLMFELN